MGRGTPSGGAPRLPIRSASVQAPPVDIKALFPVLRRTFDIVVDGTDHLLHCGLYPCTCGRERLLNALAELKAYTQWKDPDQAACVELARQIERSLAAMVHVCADRARCDCAVGEAVTSFARVVAGLGLESERSS